MYKDSCHVIRIGTFPVDSAGNDDVCVLFPSDVAMPAICTFNACAMPKEKKAKKKERGVSV